MTSTVETTALRQGGWQVARIVITRNGEETRFELRFRESGIYYIARSGAHSLAHQGEDALMNWLALRKISSTPGFQSFVIRWHRKALDTVTWTCTNCGRRNDNREAGCEGCGMPREWSVPTFTTKSF